MAQETKFTDDRNLPIYIDSELDDAGLTANQFRVYARLARRAGRGEAFEAIDSMAKGCRLERKTIIGCLKDLLRANLIHKKSRIGKTATYTLTNKSEWKLEKLDRHFRENKPHPISTPPNQHPTPHAVQHPGYPTQSAPP